MNTRTFYVDSVQQAVVGSLARTQTGARCVCCKDCCAYGSTYVCRVASPIFFILNYLTCMLHVSKHKTRFKKCVRYYLLYYFCYSISSHEVGIKITVRVVGSLLSRSPLPYSHYLNNLQYVCNTGCLYSLFSLRRVSSTVVLGYSSNCNYVVL
jgi:hypothetical protein